MGLTCAWTSELVNRSRGAQHLVEGPYVYVIRERFTTREILAPSALSHTMIPHVHSYCPWTIAASDTAVDGERHFRLLMIYRTRVMQCKWRRPSAVPPCWLLRLGTCDTGISPTTCSSSVYFAQKYLILARSAKGEFSFVSSVSCGWRRWCARWHDYRSAFLINHGSVNEASVKEAPSEIAITTSSEEEIMRGVPQSKSTM